MTAVSQQQLMEVFRKACEIELQAFKPGNVSVYAAGHDMTIDDFSSSAEVSAEPLTNPRYTLGEKIYRAVKATREAVGCNTNLGILLLCAPLLQAVQQHGLHAPLRKSLASVLAQTTVMDAEWVFRAISLASPGGLGRAEQQDVAAAATVTLTEAMCLAAGRDRIAAQYATNYKDVFEFAILRYNNQLNRWGYRKWAAVAVYAGLLCKFPDTHIERKYGKQFNELIRTRMEMVDNMLLQAEQPKLLENTLYQIDAEFKKLRLNPGSSADLTVTTLLVACLEGLPAGSEQAKSINQFS